MNTEFADRYFSYLDAEEKEASKVIHHVSKALPDRSVGIIGTGGGCTALQVSEPNVQDGYWLITDDSSIPKEMESDYMAVGLYVGERWLCWSVGSIKEALLIISSFEGAEV